MIARNVKINSVMERKETSPEPTIRMKMRKAEHVNYDFIVEDKKNLSDNNRCTIDNIVGTYGPLIKGLTVSRFIELCYLYLGIDTRNEKQKSLLDQGIADEHLYDYEWYIDQGVTPEMVHYICKHYDISHYCLDINKNCYLKYISRNREYRV